MLVLLLITPPLLLPPGMCICQFVSIGKAAASASATPDHQPAVEDATDSRPDCTCESCRRARTAPAVPQRSDDQPTHSPSAPAPEKHWPGCPAAIGDLPLDMAVATVTVQADLVATASFLTPTAEPIVSPDRAAPVSTEISSPPLFISHCALRF